MTGSMERMDTFWQPLADLKARIDAAGGFVNAHAHFDRAYSVLTEDFDSHRVESHLHEKWKLVDEYKERTQTEGFFAHIWMALRAQADQGVKHSLSFIDVDPLVGTKALDAAVKARELAARELHMRFLIASQTLKGVVEPEARRIFEENLDRIDVIGGLPGADRGRESEHLDVLLEAVKKSGKRAHIHVDQLNSPQEKETELLCRKIMKWGVEGKVTAVHSISVASHKREYRNQVYQMARDAGLSFVACPSAWIDHRRSDEMQPVHNAVTPVDELIPAGLTVALGTDNIADVYKPYSDGNMMVELRMILESCHFYDRNALVHMATAAGKHVLGVS